MPDSNVVVIDLGMFLTDSPEVVQEYEEHGYKDFPSYDMFKNFFVEIGSKYPEGVSEEYFTQLYQSYTTSLALKNMMDLRLIEEIVKDDGSIGYRVTSSET